MKKISIRILIAVLISTFFSCGDKEAEEIAYKRSKGYVYLDRDSFLLDDKPFFPLIMNYMSLPRLVNDSLVLSPTLEYDSAKVFEGRNSKEIHQRFKAHLQAIKQMGFNTIRLVGLNPLIYREVEGEQRAGLETYRKERDSYFLDVNGQDSVKLINTISDAFDIAGELDFKIIFQLPRPRKDSIDNALRLQFIKRVLRSFRDEPIILAYDFFNEPIYFDNSEYSNWEDVHREKKDAIKIVEGWRSLMKKLAPYQLFTISFAEPIEVFEWDPSLLDIDFVSIHTYHPLRVQNEIYWFSKYINKPWIISETSLPADNDSISYKDQATFMKEALQKTINCGGIGFGWWQYQDVEWGPFEHDHTAIVNANGKTVLENGDTIYGTIKDAGRVLPSFEFKKTGECDCPINYFNMMGYENYLIKGNIVDNEMNPIEGAVVRGWNQRWNIGMNTFSNQAGDFHLYSNDENVHFEISAPGYNTLKFQMKFDYDTLEKFKGKKLHKRRLEYHRNHFQWYLKPMEERFSVFNFAPWTFDRFKLRTKMPVQILEKIEQEQE